MSIKSARREPPNPSRTKPNAAKRSLRSPSPSITSSVRPASTPPKSNRSYVIVFTWPSGKVRYLTRLGVTPNADLAQTFTIAEAGKIVRHGYKDARLVWGIVTSRKRIDKL